MAEYSIVLNLAGNAVTRVERLSAALAAADRHARSLSGSLTGVGVASGRINTLRGGVRPGNSSVQAGAQLAAAATRMNTAATRLLSAANRLGSSASSQNRASNNLRHAAQSNAYQTRHRATRIFSMGTGFNIGGVNGRLSSIFQPDENGRLFGMDANRLARAANISGIVGAAMKTIAKGILKTIAISTITPIAIGGGGLMTALRALQSESFAEGVRLISRRHQAQLGLGGQYAQAQTNADFLASSYGLDRSTTLSSINVLTGLGVGGSSRKIDLNEATGLTKVGGLISQHHGVPFERVMTNIQQLLVQDQPHIRDIRELLNQAPILGKYALREMEERGVEGVDMRTYLKDQRNILSVLKSYELDNATNAGMQARGRIGLAKQDFWANIAGNDPFWSYIGHAGAGVIGAGGNAINNLMTALAGNDSFKVMVKQIELMIDNLATKGVTLVDKLISFIEKAGEQLGLDLGDRSVAKLSNDRENVINALARDPNFRSQYANMLEENGMLNNIAPGMRDKAINQLITEGLDFLRTDRMALESIQGIGKLFDSNSEFVNGKTNTPFNRVYANRERIDDAVSLARTFGNDQFTFYPVEGSLRGYNNVRSSEVWKRGMLRNPVNSHAAYTVPYDSLFSRLGSFFTERSSIGTLDPSLFPGKGIDGDDLTGNNRDRRALEIHFHAPIVEWTSTINSTSPQETVDEIAVNIEQIASAAIQRALLGASNKMGSRWY